MDRQTFRRILLKSAFRKRKMYETLLDNVPMLKALQVRIFVCIFVCNFYVLKHKQICDLTSDHILAADTFIKYTYYTVSARK